MLSIVGEPTQFGTEQTQDLHIPGDRPWIKAEEVLSVQADCDELQLILEEISGIPHHANRRVQRWYGDDAKFIVANLFVV